MYVPNYRASNYLRQKLIEMQKEIDESTVIVGVFNTPLSEMDSKKKISKDIVGLSSTIKHMGIIDMATLTFKRLEKCNPFMWPSPRKRTATSVNSSNETCKIYCIFPLRLISLYICIHYALCRPLYSSYLTIFFTVISSPS